MPTIQNFKEFLQFFLEKRGVNAPDGRPLYEYKISKGRYDCLKILLKESWQENSFCYACFVLYAVEFLRAESSEGHLRWDYIFNSIGKDRINSPQNRTKIVEIGLKFWRREVFQGQNREFLETLRFESGLPNSSLHDNNNLSSLIKAIFQIAESYRLKEEELIPIIEERIEKYPIPMVLRQYNFYSLVTKLCFKFLEFKLQFDLASKSNPTEYLQSQLTTWRNEMPLKIEGDRMNEFFNKIISDISKLEKIEPLALRFETILTEGNGEFIIKTLLSISKGVYSHEAFGLKEDEFDTLPGYFSLNIEVEGKIKYLTSFTKVNSGKISARGLDGFILPFDVIDKEWVLTFSSENMELRVESEIAKYFKIQSSEPLVFTEENYGKWVFKGSAPLKIKELVCRVLIDESLFSIENLAIQQVGNTLQGLTVYQLDSDCLINDIENQSAFWVKLAQENDSNKILDFSNRSLPESGSFYFLRESKNQFLGFPRVHLLDRKHGLKESFLGTIEVLNYEKQWEVSNLNVFGRKRFRFKDRKGNILGTKTLNIFPLDFKVFVKPNTKQIELQSQRNFSLLEARNGIETEIKSIGEKIEIRIDPSETDSNRTFVDLSINFGSGEIVDMKVPNPNFNEVFVDGNGKVVNRTSFSLSNIHGSSIILNNYLGIAEKKTYSLKLFDIHDGEASSLVIKKEIVVEPFSSNRLPLYQWVKSVNQLFALTHNTRAKVRISSSTPHHYIEIAKYDMEFIFDYSTGSISCQNEVNELNLKLSAFRLDKVFTSEELVDIQLIDNKCNLIETLPSEGVWFVFSNLDSEKLIIPTVIIIGEKGINADDGPIQHLWEGSFLDYDQRIQRFKEFFDSCYLNFDHEVWKELYELFKATEHLPISALDVWKGLVKSPKGMLTLLFSSYADSALIQKVSQELGFLWHLVSLYMWQEVFTTWLEKLTNSENYFQFLDAFKSDKLNIIENELGLYSLVELLNQTPNSFPIQSLKDIFHSVVNGGAGKLGVRARNPQGVYWASFVGNFIVEKFTQLPEELRSILPDGLHGWQKPVIYLPVILAFHSVNGRLINAQELNPEILLGFKLNMDFDKEYFDDVYSMVQGFCFSQYFYNPNNA
ncbi:STY4851/ECs_5259 family protein [Algoriphagus sp. D3-2-R+10]|uniref:STY4851/ECs_5259 family protein n=1 Tax=Algoriphagus aurantiacus TaxID=3103948 RepID=UPI002B380075|nr:STY4851/ECs_5259 family protein [Algoriphagus sp. D3-2-R+10]MEB2777480.1 STY4851/ECs_5259 family protein [Algoriphagus sp. D3-2-R+10]